MAEKISYTYHGLVYDYDPSATYAGWILNLQSTPKDELIKNRKLVISNRQPISYYGEEKPCVGISYTEKIHEFANKNAVDRLVFDITKDIKYTDGMTRLPFRFGFNRYGDLDKIDSGTTLKDVFLNVDPHIISQTSTIPGQQTGFVFFDYSSDTTFFIDKNLYVGDRTPSVFPSKDQVQKAQHYVFSSKGGDCGYIELYTRDSSIPTGTFNTEWKIKHPIKHMNCKLPIGKVLDLYDVGHDGDAETSTLEPKFIPMQFPFDINIKDECIGFAQHNGDLGDFYTMTSSSFTIYNDNKSVMLSPYEGAQPEIIWHGDPVLFARTAGNPKNATIYVKDKTMYPYAYIDNELTLNTGIKLKRQSDSSRHSVGYPQNKYGYSVIGSANIKIGSAPKTSYVDCVHDIDVSNYNCSGDVTPTPKPTVAPSFLTYKTGSKVKLVNKAEYCQSVIADGKELINDSKSGALVVPELKDEKVYITFKKDLNSLKEIFGGCTSLQSIPENLFARNPEVTNFYGAFAACTSLQSIPESLFTHNPDVTNFSGSFSGCTSLQSIPESLFTHNPDVTDFYGAFTACTSLQSIPENLFTHNTKITNFSGSFAGCTSLQSIPKNLFARNPEVTDFTNAFGGCTSLQSIPESMFTHNTKVTNFSYAFNRCTALQSIPESLFTHNTKVTNFSEAFNSCAALTGESPYTMVNEKKVHLYERKEYPDHFTVPTNFTGVFSGCTGLTDYSQIPAGWK